jgi:hypothetical protein
MSNLDPKTNGGHLSMLALQIELNELDKRFEARAAGIEKAVDVAHENLVRVPTDVDKSINHLGEVTAAKFEVVVEKFKGIDTQFVERDTRVDQTRALQKEALDAALQAAKELVGKQNDNFAASIAKSDAGTTKLIDGLLNTISQAASATSDKIDDLKQRLTLLEGTDRGKSVAVVEKQASSTSMINIVGMIAGWALAIVALITLLLEHHIT